MLRRRLARLARTRRPARYLTDVRALAQLSPADVEALDRVSRRFAFRANDYYVRLIDWSADDDPVRRLIVPDPGEMAATGWLDASDEASNSKLPGLQHKYADTALMLVTDQCAGFCRYCFRKRLFRKGNRETLRDVAPGIEYVKSHPGITDVLLSGGDPLTLPTPRLAAILRALAAVPHVRAIRIGSKMLAFNPYRVLDDRDLHELFREHRDGPARVHLMCHFDHPRELTPEAVEAVRLLQSLGVSLANQCPLTAGINDHASVLSELFQACTDAGCPQYYVFQCRPTIGNAPFQVPLVRGFELFSRARASLSGLSRRARYCMSHSSGKVEVVGVDEERVYARYHRAKDPADEDRMLVLARDDAALWLDELRPWRDLKAGRATA